MIIVQGGSTGRGFSRLASAARCLREHALSHIAGFRSGGSPAMTMGSLVHAGCAQHYAQIGAGQPGGVLVNGERVKSALVAPGDEIGVGECRIEVRASRPN